MEFRAHVDKLVGTSNWSKWKRQVELLLRHYDVHELISGDRVCPVLAEDATPEVTVLYEKSRKSFMKDDSLAQHVLVGSMDDANVELTATCDSAKSIWEKLLSVYEQNSGQRLDRLMEQFFRSEKDGDDDVVTHIAKLQKNFSELNDELKRVAKTTIPKLLLMSRIMSTLPSEFFEFKSVWESIPIEERSVNKLTERLRLIEMRLPSKLDSTALIATKKKAAKKEERKCYVCRKPGHIAKDCWKRDRKQKTSGDAFVCIVEGVTEKEQWIADSGASAHMTSYRKYFLDFKEFPSPKPVYVGNNNAIMAYGQGTVNDDMKVNGKWVSNHLSEVWYVPDVSRNLFSVSQTLAKGFVFRAEGNECSFTRDGHVRLRDIRTVNGLYALKMRVVCPEVPAEVCFASADQSLQLWHERLCHQNKTYVKEFLGQRGIEVCESKVSCEGCLYGKQQRGRFHERPSRPIVTGALIHADVCGPMQERSIGRSRYFVCFKDDFSRFRRVFFMESKSEVSNCLKVFLSEAKTAGHTIRVP
ncbi:Retrovirus-related Pol polyprotein from transposon TNT 1-94 [Araneus ventricosus]|uniref:Retrovirus-related Pol polyprotein from transposon TNT 1-94 n=1 Tax=Araneus ventricosus TaxID=182803 RepID=A0A4Y2RXW3_ARAVE|nr:Retrovirus-related Pol polyprotein from transposon TNT 1-94 [Araneus ventricosus]